MGDWSYTSLKVLKGDKERTASILEKDADNIEDPDDPVFVSFGFESNYCRLSYHDELVEAGIPYEFSWSASGDSPEGESYSRYTATGEHTLLELFYGDERPCLDNLLELIDQPEKLRTYILQHQQATTPMPWDNQEAYGKLYRTHQLIAPTTKHR